MQDMWRIGFIAFLLLGHIHCLFAATIRVMTWNLNWFPDGPSINAQPDAGRKRIKDVAEVLSVTNADVVLLQEVRDNSACEALVKEVRGINYSVLVCSQFVEDFGHGASRQQL